MPITFSELIDCIVIILYYLKKQRRSGYFSLKSILKILQYPYTYSDIYQIAKYLQADGLVNVNESLGDVFVELTTQGTINAEKKQTILPNYEAFIKSLEGPKLFDEVKPYSEETIAESRQILFESLAKLREKVRNQFGDKSDGLYDIDVIVIELTKYTPNREIIMSKLFSLKNYPSIRFDIKELAEMMNLDLFH